jgi:hypothetical protein
MASQAQHDPVITSKKAIQSIKLVLAIGTCEYGWCESKVANIPFRNLMVDSRERNKDKKWTIPAQYTKRP